MPLPEDHKSHEPTPSATAESKDTEASLFRLLDRLSPNQREVIRLKFQNDLSYQEIAEIMGITESTSKSQLNRAKAKLRESLETMGVNIKH